MPYQRKTPKKPENYIEEMVLDYQAGKTLAEIGAKHGVSRQRVHQIFKDRGITSAGKGVHARKEARLKTLETAREKRIMQTWGLSLADYEAHVAVYGASTESDTPMHKYKQQQRHCLRRGIVWQFTFKTWWALWEGSGKWNERGRSKYVMGREGDGSTPMGPDTCRVSTLSEILCGDFFVRGRNVEAQPELMAA